MIMNLCTNAAQAMEEKGGILAVSVGPESLDAGRLKGEPDLRPGPYVRLTVRDAGHGIGEDHMDRIFDPYFTTREVGKGSGMGLAVVHGIVKSHGGLITVESAVDHGATFHVYLPVNPEPSPEADPDEPLRLPTGTERILVVEDEPSVAEMTRERLVRLGYAVTVEQDSLEALARFRAAPEAFDLVISDQTMPKMTGKEQAAALMEIRPDIRVILCTGHSAHIDAEKAALLDIAAFVMKPVEKDALAEIVPRVLDDSPSKP